jgi:hypothetical protein
MDAVSDEDIFIGEQACIATASWLALSSNTVNAAVNRLPCN